jgi:hypothetical protein
MRAYRPLSGESPDTASFLFGRIGTFVPCQTRWPPRQRLRVSLIADALLELVRLSQPARVKSCLLRHRALRHRFVVIISRLGLYICT